MAILIGVIGMVAIVNVNYQIFRQLVPFVYGASIFLLVAVLGGGSMIHGTRGWFKLGLFQFQPVEIAKFFFILALAGFLDGRWRETKRLSTVALALLMLGGNIILILMQPDFGSTLSYFPATLVLLFLSGVEPLYLLGMVIFGAIAACLPLMSTYFRMQPDLFDKPVTGFIAGMLQGGWHSVAAVAGIIALLFLIWWFMVKLRWSLPLAYPVILSLIIVAGSLSSIVVQKSLKEYQRKRLVVFVNPEIDPLGSGYNIIQSKIAIGSGKVFGKGLFSGTQSQLGFLPEQHTDFIYSVIGEETGYLFSQLTIVFYFILVWRAMLVAREARDRYGSLIAAGVATLFAFYGVINMGMVMGLMPATGLPLPLVSYGGSSMVTSLWGIGILMCIHLRRFTN